LKSHNLSPKKRQQYQQGFSLLEALIASTIFASVLLIASSAFKFFMSIGTRSVNSEQVMQETMSSIKFRDSIKGLSHYYIRDNAVNLDDAKPFFLGNEKGFTGITLNAIDFSKQPTRISVALQTAKSNIVELVYCEYNNKMIYPTGSINPECDTPKVMAFNIKSLDFDYFGWPSLNALYNIRSLGTVDDFTNKKGWAKHWDAKKRGILPQYIKISIIYNEIATSYQPSQLWFKIADADPVQFNVNTTSDG